MENFVYNLFRHIVTKAKNKCFPSDRLDARIRKLAIGGIKNKMSTYPHLRSTVTVIFRFIDEGSCWIRLFSETIVMIV